MKKRFEGALDILNDKISSFPSRLKEVIGDDSVRYFARRCGIAESAIRQYLKGASEPTLGNLLAMSYISNISVNWLAAGEENKDIEAHKNTRLLSKWFDIFNIMNESDQLTALNNLMARGYKQLLINPEADTPKLSSFKQIIMDLLLELNEEEAKEILLRIGKRNNVQRPTQKQA